MARGMTARGTQSTARGQRGGALVEYVLLLMLFSLSVTVGLNELNRSVEEEADETGAEIGADPGSIVPSSSSSSVVIATTGGPVTFPVNSPPVVVVPDVTIDPGQSFQVAATVTDDFTPLGAMGLDWSVQSGLTLDATSRNGGANQAVADLTADRPGFYTVTLCANDGLAQTCDSGMVKVRYGVVTVDIVDAWSAWTWWDGSQWRWGVWADVAVTDAWGGGVPDVTVTATIATSNGPRATSCTTRGSGRCRLGTDGLFPPANAGTVTATGAASPCIDGWVGDTVVRDYRGLGAPPPPPSPTTTSGGGATSPPTSGGGRPSPPPTRPPSPTTPPPTNTAT